MVTVIMRIAVYRGRFDLTFVKIIVNLYKNYRYRKPAQNTEGYAKLIM